MPGTGSSPNITTIFARHPHTLWEKRGSFGPLVRGFDLMAVPPHLVTGLKKAPGLKLSLFRCHYVSGNYLSRIATRNLHPAAHQPLAPKTKDLYRGRERGTLWWSVTIQTVPSSTKRVVRSWGARRVRQAFRQALRERGFDKAGKKLVLDEAGNVVGRRKCLEGTMELRILPKLILAKYTSVMDEARRTVGFLEKEAQAQGRRT